MDPRRRMHFPRVNKPYNGKISKLSLTISNHKNCLLFWMRSRSRMTDDFAFSSQGVNSSWRELFMRRRRICTPGTFHPEYSSMEWLVSQSRLTIFTSGKIIQNVIQYIKCNSHRNCNKNIYTKYDDKHKCYT